MSHHERRFTDRHPLCTCPRRTTFPGVIEQQPDCPGGTIAHPPPLELPVTRMKSERCGLPGTHEPHQIHVVRIPEGYGYEECDGLMPEEIGELTEEQIARSRERYFELFPDERFEADKPQRPIRTVETVELPVTAGDQHEPPPYPASSLQWEDDGSAVDGR